MSIGRIAESSSGRCALAFFENGEVFTVPGESRVTSVDAFLRLGADERALLRKSASRGRDAGEMRCLAPIVSPSKVVCVGQNYPEHNDETGFERPAEPLIFSKFPSAIIGPGEVIELPAVAPRRVDYEAELAVVIGRKCRNVPQRAALGCVAGYMAANDISARDWQVKKPGGQWLLGKTFDTFLPLGPVMVTADEIGDPQDLRIQCAIGGEILQDDTTGNMIFPVSELLAYISSVCTLEVGDVLLTGSPAGVGMSRKPPRWLAEGDVVKTSIDGIGTLENSVVKGVSGVVI
jgi:2-keto-4-pentenoate hydratase/2-oxohepta-3-ene-1,7-dioic acid hydratase in catechol pathway